MGEIEISVYGAHWCQDCRISKQFLGEHQIPYKWIDIEQDREAEVKEFIGERSKLTKLRIKNNLSGTEEEMSVDGVFIFIGLVPITALMIREYLKQV
jgi:thioredoxin reductase